MTMRDLTELASESDWLISRAGIREHLNVHITAVLRETTWKLGITRVTSGRRRPGVFWFSEWQLIGQRETDGLTAS
jgi:hypothetical protein